MQSLTRRNPKTWGSGFGPILTVERFATEDETTFIKNHLYVAPNKSVKQTEMGIEDKDIIQVRNYKFTNIIAVGKTPMIEEMWASIEK